MDPEATLREIHELTEKLTNDRDNYSTQNMAEMGRELANLIDALDGWLKRGGALPLVWRVQHYVQAKQHANLGVVDPLSPRVLESGRVVPRRKAE